MSLTNRTHLAKQVASFAGIVVAGAITALPAFAQLNPNPSIFNQPPFNRSRAAIPAKAEANSTTPASQTPVSQTPASQTPASQTPAVGGTSATPPATGTSGTPTGTAAQRTSASGTIVDVAAASDTFKTLVAALNQAELTEVLQGQGPFTVFAPTDEAFAALPSGTVETLLKPENRATLVKLLKYHVVSGSFPSTQLSSGEVKTVEGSAVKVTVSNGTVKVNEATVIQADIPASNGVIHAIDRVIIPPDLSATSK